MSSEHHATPYAQAMAESRREAEAYWLRAAAALDWDRPPQRALHGTPDAPGWFADGRLNTCWNAVDRHVAAGHGERIALIHDSPVTGQLTSFSYAELQTQVARTAGMLQALGVAQGDRVVIYMPMVPQAVFAMLACARIGAVHSVVFGGFAAPELAKRIDDAQPKVVMSASCGIEPSRVVAYKPLLDQALELARHRVDHCLLLQRPQLPAELQSGRDLDWVEQFEQAEPASCVSLAATDPLYVLYTSGTTGVPKGVVRDNGGHAVALRWSMEHIYGVRPGEVFCAGSDIGWVVGHSYIVYGPLLQGCTTILYEGKPVGTPDAGAYWRMVEQHRIQVLFTAPTAIRAIRREDPRGEHIGRHDLSSLRALFLAGERADPDTVLWAAGQLQRPVVDHWWQTELGWPAVATCLGLGERDTCPGSAGRPVPGFRFAVLDESHAELAPGQIGDIAIELPLPPGCFPGLWQNPAGFRRAYLEAHPGYYTTGDAGHIDEQGYVHVMSRIDDIINVAGHRIATGAIEGIVAAHPAVAECAVIGAADSIKGQVPIGLVVRKAGIEIDDAQMIQDIVRRVREELGPVAAFKAVGVVTALPKTRSGKILRDSLRKLANGQECKVPPTIEDPQALSVAENALRKLGG